MRFPIFGRKHQPKRINPISLDDHRRIWAHASVICSNCNHTWTAVFHRAAEQLECPSCSTMNPVV